MTSISSPCPVMLPDHKGIDRAVSLLQSGALVALPTETVYGLGANAQQEAAVRAIYLAKGRPSYNPLIVHVTDAAMAARYAESTKLAQALMARFWPGPLTLVMPLKHGCALAPSVLGGGQTVALRSPSHPVMQEVIRRLDAGIAAPSANRSGRVSPSLAAHVAQEFVDSRCGPALILDAGACKWGLESTVIDCCGSSPVILRPGCITIEQLEVNGFAANPTVIFPCNAEQPNNTEPLPSPGLLSSHYAPVTPLRLQAMEVAADEALLAFGAVAINGTPLMTRNLSEAGDLAEAAHFLYAHLRTLDAAGARCIAVTPIPEQGMGRALNDRLRRAASDL